MPVIENLKGPPGSAADISACWPIGAVFTSVVSTNPAILLGFGTWVSLGTGRVLVGYDANDSDFNAAEKTGGSKTGTPAGTVSQPTFTGTSGATSANSAGTPAGTVSQPTFTGSALGTHQHELPFQDPSGSGTTNFRGINPTTFGTGTSRAGVWGITTTANTTSAAVAMSQAITAGTPTGTVSQPTFTGSAMGTHSHTITPAGTLSQPIFAGSSMSVVQPFDVVFFWKRTA
jgi:hypothetical protein